MSDQLAWGLVIFVFGAFALIMLAFALHERRRSKALRAYADALAEQNEELRRIIAGRSRAADGTLEDVLEEMADRPGPRDTIH